mgnify:CR=1 FL=1
MRRETWAPAGAVLSALCLLELGPITGFLRSVGGGFLLELWIVLPLLALFLAVTLWTLATDRRYHRSPAPSRLSWAATALMAGGWGLWKPAAWAGVALLAGAAVWNVVLVRRLTGRRARAREVGRKLG